MKLNMKMNAQLNMKLCATTPNQLMEDCPNTTLGSEDKQTVMEHLKHHPFQLVEYLGWQAHHLQDQVPHQAIAHPL